MPDSINTALSDRQRDLLGSYLSDAIALQKHLREALERQRHDKRTAPYPEALETIRKIENTMLGHLYDLEPLKSEQPRSPLKEAVAGVTGAAAGLIDRMRASETVSQMLRDDYAALGLDAMGYTILHTAALAVGDRSLAELALRHLHALTPLIVEISEVLPAVVARELASHDLLVDASAADEALRGTQHAWSREVVR